VVILDIICLLCAVKIPPSERIDHATKFHGLTLMEISVYGIFGLPSSTIGLEHAEYGICAECSQPLEQYEIVSVYRDFFFEETFIVRCFSCKGLMLCDDLGSLGMSPTNNAKRKRHRNCVDCAHAIIDGDMPSSILCSAYKPEVIIDSKAYHIAETCEEYSEE